MAQEFPVLTFAAAKEGAEAGNARAQAALSLYYRYGYQTPQSIKDAESAIAPVNAQNCLCQYSLAVLLTNQAECSRDPAVSTEKAAEAKQLFHLSFINLPALVQQGDPYAELLLGGLYETGRGEVKIDFAKAGALYLSASRKELPLAFVNLARLIIDGKGLQKNPALAVTLYEKAAKAGVGSANFELGNAYFAGKVTAASPAQARSCWEKAATQYNHGPAQYALGRALMDGLFGRPDTTEGSALIFKAAKNDCPEAVKWVAESGLTPPASTGVTDGGTAPVEPSPIPAMAAEPTTNAEALAFKKSYAKKCSDALDLLGQSIASALKEQEPQAYQSALNSLGVKEGGLMTWMKDFFLAENAQMEHKEQLQAAVNPESRFTLASFNALNALQLLGQKHCSKALDYLSFLNSPSVNLDPDVLTHANAALGPVKTLLQGRVKKSSEIREKAEKAEEARNYTEAIKALQDATAIDAQANDDQVMQRYRDLEKQQKLNSLGL